jgi:hypothetical protein
MKTSNHIFHSVHSTVRALVYSLACLLVYLPFPACSDLLEVDSNRYLSDQDNTLNSPNDSVYSLFGILSGMQDLAGKYFVLGELRGDLAGVTGLSDRFLREINNHEPLSKDNPYADLSPYYQVINHCNYVIAKMDTTVGNRALLPDYAAAVKIRAWVYFQLAKNYAQVRYYTNPVLTVEEAGDMSKYPALSLSEMIDALIPQVEAVQHVAEPAYEISGIPVGKMIPSADFLLGDLYLWKDDYEQAAWHYKYLMEQRQSGRNFLICDDTYRIAYLNNGISISWQSIFSPSNFQSSAQWEVSCGIYYHYTLGKADQAVEMCAKNGSIQATEVAIAKWLAQTSDNPNMPEEYREYGDWRGKGIDGYGFSWDTATVYDPAFLPKEDIARIMKHQADTSSGGRIILERAGLLALRYAEAINRAGKPTMALAAINEGLKAAVIHNPAIVNPKELETGGYVVDFNYAGYDINLGVRGRVGLTPYLFRSDLSNLQDSIRYVEDLIVEELAMETAFEGNRWTDLLRIAFRRIEKNDPGASEFLPQIIGSKFESSGNAEVVRSRLRNKENFFIH